MPWRLGPAVGWLGGCRCPSAARGVIIGEPSREPKRVAVLPETPSRVGRRGADIRAVLVRRGDVAERGDRLDSVGNRGGDDVDLVAAQFENPRSRHPAAVFPLALGISLVPRGEAGSLMGATAAACAVARQAGVYLVGLGGTHGGIIGALAAVGLAATGDDGRVLYLGQSPRDWHEVSGRRSVDELRELGIAEIRCLHTGVAVERGEVELPKRLRPNLRGGRPVLFVESAKIPWSPHSCWNAIRVD